MRKQGIVVRWDAARGFGFIRSPQIMGDVFFHKRDFRSAELPREGLKVSFEDIHVGGKGPRAMAVQSLAAAAVARRTPPEPVVRRPVPNRRTRPASAASSGGSALWLLLLLGWMAALTWGVSTGRLPLIAVPIALLLNLATFFAYWLDKYAAQKGQWRIAEQTLHIFALVGGWPGAWVAQRVLRHKSSKASFLATYRVTVFMHCVVLSVWVFQQQLHGLLKNP